MRRLEMKNYNMILTEKQQKYQPNLQVKLINMEYLTSKKILPSDPSRMIERGKFILLVLFQEKLQKNN